MANQGLDILLEMLEETSIELVRSWRLERFKSPETLSNFFIYHFSSNPVPFLREKTSREIWDKGVSVWHTHFRSVKFFKSGLNMLLNSSHFINLLYCPIQYTPDFISMSSHHSRHVKKGSIAIPICGCIQPGLKGPKFFLLEHDQSIFLNELFLESKQEHNRIISESFLCDTQSSQNSSLPSKKVTKNLSAPFPGFIGELCNGQRKRAPLIQASSITLGNSRWSIHVVWNQKGLFDGLE